MADYSGSNLSVVRLISLPLFSLVQKSVLSSHWLKGGGPGPGTGRGKITAKCGADNRTHRRDNETNS